MPTTTVTIDAARFFGQASLRHITDTLDLTVTEHCFPPRPDDLQADWVASVAAPAFRLLAAEPGGPARRAFCAIGTGVGLDALAAAEILGATEIGITDVHQDVVAAASDNIRRHLRQPGAVRLLAGAGDLLEPLRAAAPRFDVIYENLPNLPLAETASLERARTSSSFVPPRREPVPPAIRDTLLTLHYLALLQARDVLAPGGVVLSMLGGRLPLRAFLDMAAQAGYAADFLTYGWKVQAEAEDIIRGHADWQSQGLGPFHFYRPADLDRIFAGLTPQAAAARALDIEAALRPFAIDPETALAAHAKGERVGHTYAVLRSRPEA